MRKKLNKEEKRANIIGIKVKPEIKKQLIYIANREATSLSTYINEQLVKHIQEYFTHAHINWNTLTEEEKEGREE